MLLDETSILLREYGARKVNGFRFTQRASDRAISIDAAQCSADSRNHDGREQRLLAILPLRHHKLHSGAGPDLTPSMYWPQQLIARAVDGDRGPVLVTVEYRVVAGNRDAFLAAINRQGAERRRNGAYRWGVFEDAANPGRWLESFLVDSWLESLRELKRVTHADHDLNDAVLRFHEGDPPRITHFVAP